MSFKPQRRLCLRAGLGAVASSWLPRAQACEFYSSTLRITHPWCQATREGESSVLVSMRFDEVQEADQLVRVEIDIAGGAHLVSQTPDNALRRERPLPFDIPAGRETELGERGTGLLLTALTQPLTVGTSFPLYLHFANGGRVSAQLSVDYPSFRFQ